MVSVCVCGPLQWVSRNEGLYTCLLLFITCTHSGPTGNSRLWAEFEMEVFCYSKHLYNHQLFDSFLSPLHTVSGEYHSRLALFIVSHTHVASCLLTNNGDWHSCFRSRTDNFRHSKEEARHSKREQKGAGHRLFRTWVTLTTDRV